MRTIAGVVPLVLALAACGQQNPSTQQQTTAPKFTVAALQAMPKAPDGADGSGCLADAGTLPDGAWFGFVRGWDQTGIDLDPACFYTGAEAAKAATAHNDESPPPNDFFIANDTKVVRRIPAGASAAAYRVTHDKDGGVTTQKITFGELVTNSGTYQKCPDELCGVWVYVNGGTATEVQMQYLP